MKRKSTKIIISIVFLLIGSGIFLTGFGQTLDAKVIQKEKFLKEKLIKKGFIDDYTRISGKRSKWLNEILPLSAKNSTHLSGQAIDILVGDVNNDSKKDAEDIKIVVTCLEEIEKENPTLVGGIGTYLTKGYLSNRMVHLDVRGTKARWN